MDGCKSPPIPVGRGLGGRELLQPFRLDGVFVKLDVTFGDDVEGIGGKAGMRVSW